MAFVGYHISGDAELGSEVPIASGYDASEVPTSRFVIEESDDLLRDSATSPGPISRGEQDEVLFHSGSLFQSGVRRYSGARYL